jgi:CTP:molybdopterin cytidylyltransferase MocA
VRALILAAGEGRRFGGPKQLAEVEGVPLVARAVALAAPWRPLVVLGARADEVAAAVPPDVETVVAADWAEGQAASLRAGVAALGPAEDWALILLADMPFITRAACEAVIAAASPDVDAVRAVYGARPGHPVLLGRAVLDAVPALRGDTGARELLETARVATVDCSGLADPTDIDTPDQLEVP